MTSNNAIKNRYDFVYLFDVTNGNPNGDPDAGNMPRLDPDTGHGLTTDVCMKRKVRDFVHVLGKAGCEIFIQAKRALNPLIAEACREAGQPDHAKEGGGYDKGQAKNRSQADIQEVQDWLCARYFDIRAFGGVLSSGPNAGQIRGPVQFAFARSIDPVYPQEHAITRVADVDKEESEMGRKAVVPYGLYRMHGFVSAPLAARTGFSNADCDMLWDALERMLDIDRSAARGEMNQRGLYIFEHATPLGNAPAHKLFDRITVRRAAEASDGATLPPPRVFSDYVVEVDRSSMPKGVKLLTR